MNRIFLTTLLMATFITAGCASLSKKEEAKYHAELAKVENLDRAIEIFKAAEWSSPLETEAKEKIVIILRNKELPKAKLARDYFIIMDKLPWQLALLKDQVKLHAILNLNDTEELQQILRTCRPPEQLWIMTCQKIKKLEKERKIRNQISTED